LLSPLSYEGESSTSPPTSLSDVDAAPEIEAGYERAGLLVHLRARAGSTGSQPGSKPGHPR
jgi:hypothetical protein